MRGFNRKTAPKVRDGTIQRKNNWVETRTYYNSPQPLPVIDRKRPARGFRHILKRDDILSFIGLLPDWEELSRGLNAVVLAPGDWHDEGYYVPGVIHIHAWPRSLSVWWHLSAYAEDQAFLDRLGVRAQHHGDEVLLQPTEPQVRAYQLLRVFLHELGHHHDAMTSRSIERANRGESYAEEYARMYQEAIWDEYLAAFDLD